MDNLGLTRGRKLIVKTKKPLVATFVHDMDAEMQAWGMTEDEQYIRAVLAQDLSSRDGQQLEGYFITLSYKTPTTRAARAPQQ